MKTFEDFGLSADLNKSLQKMDYKAPTPIQTAAIPLAIKGHDILGSAQTGTGKTAAFSIPLVESLLRSSYGSALVLTPTRELAKQVLSVIHDLLGRDSGINTAFIIGGEQYARQMSQLRANPRIVVGTPGRINDHLERGSLKLDDTKFLVLDETDRMLDMGFGIQLDKIVAFLPKERQTLMFSATLPKGIVTLSSKYLNNPKRVSMGETNVIATNIKQEVIRIDQPKKYQELMVQLTEREGSIIVFVKTKHGADKMAKKLRQDGMTSEALHGDLRQSKRDKVMKNFRAKNFRVLIATDIAARGLDVPHIEHVINHDLPQVPEDYIHRMGRTARAGAQGSAVSFVAPQEARIWHAIECLLDPDAKHERTGLPPQGKNKSRRKPYRGRPESTQNRSKAGPPKLREDRAHNAEQPKKAKRSDHHKKKTSEAPADYFTKDRKPKKSSQKAYSGKGKNPSLFKADGSGPMKKKRHKGKPHKATA